MAHALVPSTTSGGQAGLARGLDSVGINRREREPLDLGALSGATRGRAPTGGNSTPLADRAVYRQASEIRTVCVSRASTGLCGRCGATRIPTATGGLVRPPSERAGRGPARGARRRPTRFLGAFRDLQGEYQELGGIRLESLTPTPEDRTLRQAGGVK